MSPTAQPPDWKGIATLFAILVGAVTGTVWVAASNAAVVKQLVEIDRAQIERHHEVEIALTRLEDEVSTLTVMRGSAWTTTDMQTWALQLQGQNAGIKLLVPLPSLIKKGAPPG